MNAAKRGASALLIVAPVLFLPVCVSAQVIISEIMYDVEGSDANREWIEVFNAGAAVNLTEWRLFEGDSNHVLTAVGSETLAAGGYAVIADDLQKFREDWPSFSGRLFDSSFSLSNTGETLVLRCCSGGDLLDRDFISYSGDSGAAGDGKSLSRASVGTAAFSAAVPSPGGGVLTASSATTPAPSPSPSPTPTPTPAASGSVSGGDEGAPLSAITLDAGADRAVVVGTDVVFKARAYNRKKEPLTSLIFRWNFGDGSTAIGSSVEHVFEYPGRYAVVLTVDEDENALDQMVVTTEAMLLAFSITNGGVAIENTSKHETDISGWTIRYQGQRFTMPQNTRLLAGQTLRVTHRTLGFTTGIGAELYYPNGTLALATAATPILDPPPADPAITTSEVRSPSPVAPPPPVARTTELPTESDELEEVVEELTNVEPGMSDTASENVAAAASTSGSYTWWLGALGLALAGSGAVYAARRFKKKEWTLIDESSE